MRDPAIAIRLERRTDADAISEIVRAAFSGHPHSRQTEAQIVAALRASEALAVSLVAEVEGAVVGHVAFSSVTISGGASNWFGLGPVAVLPVHQHKGIGGALIRDGLAILRERGAKGCVVLGDPAYYRRFGFRSSASLTLAGVPADYFLAFPFAGDPPHGEVTYHAAFGVAD